MKLVERIHGSEKLIQIFGEWPSFHDSEVLSLTLERYGPTVRASIYLFATTGQIDGKGYYVLKNETVATIRFEGVVEFSANGFNHQNVLFDLHIQDVTQDQLENINFDVTFEDSYGLEATFLCRTITIESVEALESSPEVDGSPRRSGPKPLI
jgi:hypothetical protein